ncbi:MAG: hypothetical protein MJE66_21960, partial [Proteobacteria bacterium]|nr:hypothetical protein [Pseudomonadota bacterium]
MADSTSREIPRGPEPEYEKIVSGYETFHWPHEFVCEWGGRLPELTLAYYGLSESDRELRFATAPLYGLPEFATLRAILDHCHQAYCTYLASEYMNINAVEQKQWLAREL